MFKGKTKSGFEYRVAESALNDYELVESLAKLDDNPLLVVKVIEQLLGKEQVSKLKDHIRLKDGTVPLEKISEEVVSIFQEYGKAKNS